MGLATIARVDEPEGVDLPRLDRADQNLYPQEGPNYAAMIFPGTDAKLGLLAQLWRDDCIRGFFSERCMNQKEILDAKMDWLTAWTPGSAAKGAVGASMAMTALVRKYHKPARIIALGYSKANGEEGVLTRFVEAVNVNVGKNRAGEDVWGPWTWGQWATNKLTKEDFSATGRTVIPKVALEEGEDLFEHVFKKEITPKADLIWFNVTGMNIQHLAQSPPTFTTFGRLTQAELMYCISCPNLLDRMTFWQLHNAGKSSRFLVRPTDDVLQEIYEPGVWTPRAHP